jgi:hypothetical protein
MLRRRRARHFQTPQPAEAALQARADAPGELDPHDANRALMRPRRRLT